MDPFSMALIGGGALANAVGGLFGSKSAAKKQQAALREAQARLDAGYDQAGRAANTGYDEAAGYWQGGNRLMLDSERELRRASGLDGVDAQHQYAKGIYSNPLLTDAADMTARRVLAQRNALGQGRAATTQLAAQRAMQGNALSFENQNYGRLRDLYGTGQQATANLSNIAQNRGQTGMNLALGRAGAQANTTMQGGQIAATSAAAPWNALAGFGNTAAQIGGYMGGRGIGQPQNALSWPGTKANEGWATTVRGF